MVEDGRADKGGNESDVWGLSAAGVRGGSVSAPVLPGNQRPLGNSATALRQTAGDVTMMPRRGLSIRAQLELEVVLDDECRGDYGEQASLNPQGSRVLESRSNPCNTSWWIVVFRGVLRRIETERPPESRARIDQL